MSRPIFEDERIEIIVHVTGTRSDADGTERLEAQVSCAKADCTVATAGAAKVLLSDLHSIGRSSDLPHERAFDALDLNR